MQPSTARDSGQVDPRRSTINIPPLQSAALGLHPVARRLLLINRPRQIDGDEIPVAPLRSPPIGVGGQGRPGGRPVCHYHSRVDTEPGQRQLDDRLEDGR